MLSEEVNMKLKRCPVCGNEANLLHYDEGDNYAGGTVYIVKCNSCGLSTGKEYSLEKAITKWNFRPIIDKDLLPCPFCGALGVINEGYIVMCPNENCFIQPKLKCNYFSIDSAVEKWNIRK